MSEIDSGENQAIRNVRAIMLIKGTVHNGLSMIYSAVFDTSNVANGATRKFWRARLTGRYKMDIPTLRDIVENQLVATDQLTGIVMLFERQPTEWNLGELRFDLSMCLRRAPVKIVMGVKCEATEISEIAIALQDAAHMYE